MCEVCWWEDDGQDDADADLVREGPNGSISLTQARSNYRAVGASDAQFTSRVRKPTPQETP